jgi:PIN domain nuclease of toxin-antitoxin system
MRYLLDTHSLLWSLLDPQKLSKKARSAVLDSENTVAVSAVTFWEISLKFALGKLELTELLPEDLPAVAQETGLDIIPLDVSEAASFHRLPRLTHKDPFDRLIVWQAIQRKLVLICADREFQNYQEHGLRVLW